MKKSALPQLNIIQAINDPRVFGSLEIFAKRPSTVGNWLVLLKTMDGLGLSDAEFEVFKRFTGRTQRPTGPFRKILILSGRRSGKSFFTALKLVHAAVFGRWPRFLGKAYFFCLAADKFQAGVIHDFARDILNEPAFAGLVMKGREEEIKLRPRSGQGSIIISVQAANFRTLRGMKILGVAADEASFWIDNETSRNPAGEIFTSVEPALGEIPGSQIFIPTTAYIRSGPVFELFRDYYGVDDPDVLVWKSSTSDMNETYSKDVIAGAMRADASKARTEYFSEFRDDLESYVSAELISRVVVEGRTSLPYDARFTYHAFSDPSELASKSGDSMTFCVSHFADGRAVIDRLMEWRPPADPSFVVEEITAICREFHVGVICQDQVSIGWISSAFSKSNITVERCALKKTDLYRNLATQFAGELLELPDDERLMDQLLGLETHHLSGGLVRIDHAPGGGHDDLCNAVAGACWLAGEYGAQGGAFFGLIGDVSVDGPGPRGNDFPTVGSYRQ